MDEQSALLHQACERPQRVAHDARTLSSERRAELVRWLKDQADHHWSKDAHISLALATCIRMIGEVCAEPSTIGLGMMARGDALNHLGKQQAAWDALEEAAAFFRQHRDDFGWARTWIGRLATSVSFGRVEEALANSVVMRQIFCDRGDDERLMRLEMNLGVLYDRLTRHREAIDAYTRARQIVERSQNISQEHCVKLWINIGWSHMMIDHLDAARNAFTLAESLARRLNLPGMVALARINRADIDLAQGNYLAAYRTLIHVNVLNDSPEEEDARLGIIRCLVAFGNFEQAVRDAETLLRDLEKKKARYPIGLTLVQLSEALIHQGKFDKAELHLHRAEDIFTTARAEGLVAGAVWRLAEVALARGDLAAARERMTRARRTGTISEWQHPTALTLPGQIALAEGDINGAMREAAGAHAQLHSKPLPMLAYRVELLDASIAEARADFTHAEAAYQRALDAIDTLVWQMGINLRPLFAEAHSTPYHALMRLYMRQGESGCAQALITLERYRAHLFAQQTGGSSGVPRHTDPQVSQLIEQLKSLRAHLYFLMYGSESSLIRRRGDAQEQPPPSLPRLPDRELRHEIRAIEAQMTDIANRLDSLGYGRAEKRDLPDMAHIMRVAGRSTAIIAYYSDGQTLYAFVLADGTITQHSLIQMKHLPAMLDEAARWLSSAAVAGRTGCPPKWLVYVREALSALYRVLVAPLLGRIEGKHRLNIIPYGILHGQPFHLLFDGAHSLIEKYEIVIAPGLGFIGRRSPPRPRGALVLADSAGGALPHVTEEAQAVTRRFGGVTLTGADEVREALNAPPRQILHIAAHGMHHPKHPHLSCIQLGEMMLYGDELLQFDLSSELVTLSACETGKGVPVGGDEVIGIGRGFLYAGAGALLTSLWRVDDALTADLMKRFYRRLQAGQTKAGALRGAQRELLRQDPDLHPGLWGAFQLIGSPARLTRHTQSM